MNSRTFSAGISSTLPVPFTKLFRVSTFFLVNFEIFNFENLLFSYTISISFKISKCIIRVEHENLIFVNSISVVRVSFINFKYIFCFL